MKKLSRNEMKKVMGGSAPKESCFKCCKNGVCSACSWSYTGAECEIGTLTACHDTTYPCSGT